MKQKEERQDRMLTWVTEVGKHCVTAYLQKVGRGEPKRQEGRPISPKHLGTSKGASHFRSFMKVDNV